ncbi:hypothetical protein EV13_1513 [Prochlorococcus sp. MIT 0702]|nr:hypothetical protein EV13_1513 [Prochlorococcus sp. MIT 0702]KGG29194.1 hypothetical protein EV12_0245 [Prochlorococcus sp. MIT 0701]KGG34491.1 hypothetical protein EV14_1173 [Prochlorococcus sp. MIT 0703]
MSYALIAFFGTRHLLRCLTILLLFHLQEMPLFYSHRIQLIKLRSVLIFSRCWRYCQMLMSKKKRNY